MKIHEYQAKAILARHGVPVPRGEVAFNAVEAGDIARRLGGGLVVVKAQIHAGGRGKGGGVKLARAAPQAEEIAAGMNGMTPIPHQTSLDGNEVNKFVKLATGLYDAFISTDATLVEINPLVVTAQGDLLALDAKMTFDDSALYRHPDIREFRDVGEEDPLEIEASKFSLNYIHLDGNIGCMVNGAGLAMATMDIIKLAGGVPANLPG